MTAEKQPLFLRIFKDGKLLEVKQFSVDQIVIGREGNIEAVINDPSISSIHAMVENRSGTYYICDLGSQGGTFVNDQKVIDHALESGSEFRLGQVIFEFHIGIPKPKRNLEAPVVDARMADTIVGPMVNQATATAVGIPDPVTTTPISAQSTQAAPTTPAKPSATVQPPTKPVPSAAPIVGKPATVAKIPAAEVVIPKSIPKRPPTMPLTASGPVVFGEPSELTPAPASKKHGGKGTFAPPSSGKVTENIRPGKGRVVEVLVFWHERVLRTQHFDQTQLVYIGSHPNNNIVLPSMGSVRLSHPLVKIDGMATVLIGQDMTGEVVKENVSLSFDELRKKGSLVPSGAGYSYLLQQNEMIKINLGEGVGVIVRYVNQAPESKLLPFVDLTLNQLTGIIFGLMATAVFMFYAYLYAPTPPEKEEEQEPPRKALFVYKKVAVDLSEQPAPKNAPETVKTKEPPAPARGEEGASQEPKKSKNPTSKIAQKKAPVKNPTSAVPAAAPKVVSKDVTKSGLLGAFATKGLQDQLNKAYQGSGNVSGLSKSATGSAGSGEGTGVGGSLRDTGADGNGTATVGIAGVKTKGRGGGVSGYGTGSLGAKKNASLVAGDSEATFSGGIDREAIRRVVQENLKQIKACYEKGLNHNPGLYGKIVIRWTIGPGGRVTAAGIKSSSMDSSEVENCAVARLRMWKFPEPPAGELAEVSYPFVFQAQE